MQKVTLYMDDERNLYLKDKKGTQYRFWALGFGSPVAFVIETEEERHEKALKEIERDKAALEDMRVRAANKGTESWFKKFLVT